MAIEKLKRVWIPVSCTADAERVLTALVAESRAWSAHGRQGRKPPANPKLPRLWADTAIDCNANGFLAIPRSLKFCDGLIDLKSLNPCLSITYEIPTDVTLVRCIGLSCSSGKWHSIFEVHPRPPFRTYTLVPSDGQRKWLHMLFDDMLTWQQYFIRWHRIPTPYKLLPTWAMRRLWRDHGHVWPTTIRALQRLGDTQRYPKGVHVLIFRNPACGERYVDLDPIGRITVDGVIKSRNPVHARVNYCKEEDMFTIQLRDDNDYQD